MNNTTNTNTTNTTTNTMEVNTMTNTTKSIINVTVNGMTASETIENVKSRLETVEKSAFNIALLCAYGTGVTIPAYTDNKGNEHGEATCDKPIKQNDYIKLVGRSKATLSRWIKAITLIIEKGYFTDFSNGLYPFSFDKIIDILSNEEAFAGYVFADLMNLSASTLETMVKEYKPATEEEATEEAGENEETGESEEATTTEEEATADTTKEETATLTYNGKDYIVNKADFEKWLSENGKLA